MASNNNFENNICDNLPCRKRRQIWKHNISSKVEQSAFVQQRLRTYRVTWSPVKIGPFFLLVGAFFIGMGAGIKMFSDNVGEVTIRYTHCKSLESPNETCYDILKEANAASVLPGMPFSDAGEIEQCTCDIKFQLEKPLNVSASLMENTVRMFYGLTNFYQNHKKYRLSRDEDQLQGKLFKRDQPRNPNPGCEPLHRSSKTGQIIYPCGLMANSMFTDEIDLYHHMPTSEFRLMQADALSDIPICVDWATDKLVPMRKTNIAWASHKEGKYELPPGFDKPDDPKWEKFMKPYGWKTDLWGLDPINPLNNGVKNEDFMVWMRTSAFPWFRKLYRVVNSKCRPFEHGLPAGNYSIRISYNYDVSGFDGEKEIILTTTSIVSGKNTFLAVVYLSTGMLCVLLSVVIFIAYRCARQYRDDDRFSIFNR